MSTKRSIIISILFATAVLILGLVLEPQMPEMMATHWDSNGQVNGYGSHFVGIWLLPLMLVGLSLLMLAIPAIDPRRENIAKFKNEYNGFVLFFAFFLAYVQVLTLIANLKPGINLVTYMVPAFGGFIFYVGVLVAKAQSNYFVGIRTPWTLQDENVWNDTHRLGGWMFKVSGFISFLGILIPSLNIWFLLIPLLATSLITIVYSYIRYQHYHPKA